MDGLVSHLLIISKASPLFNLLLSRVHLMRLREWVEHLLLDLALHFLHWFELPASICSSVSPWVYYSWRPPPPRRFGDTLRRLWKRPMWPRFPRKLPLVVCSGEGCWSGLGGQVPPEASLFVVCSGEVCKGVVVAFKTNLEWIKAHPLGVTRKGEYGESLGDAPELWLRHRSNGD